jgi:hypothetical protein
MPRPLFTPGKDPVPIVQEAGWAPEPVWTGTPTGVRSPDRPARSQSIYRLRYQAHNLLYGVSFLFLRLGQVLEKKERKGTPRCGLDSHGSR